MIDTIEFIGDVGAYLKNKYGRGAKKGKKNKRLWARMKFSEMERDPRESRIANACVANYSFFISD